MAQLKTRIRLVYRRSSTLVKCVVLTAILLSSVTLVLLSSSIRQVNARTQENQEKAADLHRQNQGIQQDIDQLGTAESVRQLAQSLLGLVDPDTVFFEPVEPTIP